VRAGKVGAGGAMLGVVMPEDTIHKVVLASGSSGRRDILNSVDIEFTIVPSDFDEESLQFPETGRLVQALSEGKAAAVAKKFSDALVIGADNLVVVDDRQLGKPENHAEAQEMLESLSGKQHSIFNGISVVNTCTGVVATGFVETQLLFRNLSMAEIEQYVETGEPMGKAGAFAIQGQGAWLVERIEGDYYSVIGLSLVLLRRLTQRVGVDLHDFVRLG